MAAFYGRDSDDAFIEECGTDEERAALRARRGKPTSKARGPWSTVRGPVGGWRVVNRDTGQWYAVASQRAGQLHCRNLNAGRVI